MTKEELTEKIVQLGGTVTGNEPMPDLWTIYNDLKPEKENVPQQPDEIENPETDEKVSAAFKLTSAIVEHEKQIRFLKMAIISVAVIAIGGIIILIIKRK